MLPTTNLIKGTEADYLLFATQDIISQTIYRHGVWEPILTYIAKIVLHGEVKPVVFDIGANLGAFSVPIGRYIQPIKGIVHAFEPQRIIFQQLCGNSFINRLDNIYTHNIALGNITGMVNIPEIDYNNNNNIGAFSLDQYYREKHQIEQAMRDTMHAVPIKKLDNIKVDGDVKFIKIDVEGYELDVLKGALKFLKRHKMPPIIMEAWNFEWFQEGKKDLLAFLEKIGYELMMIDQTNFLAQHPKHPTHITLQKIEGNRIQATKHYHPFS